MITPSTISSLIPSKSISFGFTSSSKSSPSASGDGGGVCSYFTGARFGGGDIDGDSACDRFIFFEGGFSESVPAEGGESRAAALEACVTGRWMPSDGNDNDFRRVL